MEIQIVMSKKGKELVLLDNYKYCFVRKHKDGYIKWVCTDKNCTASIVTTVDKTSLHQSTGEHKLNKLLIFIYFILLYLFFSF